MREKVLIVAILLSSILLSGCAADEGFLIESIGKDAFEHYSGEFELKVYLLPGDDFLSLYTPESEYYHFIARYKHHFSVTGAESLLVLFHFEPSAYADAKQYCLDHMKLLDIGVPDYQNYHFLENTALPEALGRVEDGGNARSFPEQFNMFAYNDQNHILAFLGHHSDELSFRDKEKVIHGWSTFLCTYFPEITDENCWQKRDDATEQMMAF